MSDATPEYTPASSIYKTLTWILVVALIGVYALYSWYDGTLKRGLAGKDEELAQTVQRLTAAETTAKSAAEVQAGLRAEIDRLQAEARSAAETASNALIAARQELATLQARQDTHDQELASRQSEIDRLTQELSAAVSETQGLKAELDKAAQGSDAQKTELEAAEQRSAALMEEIEGLKRSLAEGAAKHASEIQGLQAQLKEREDFFRTALEGSEPERATQIARLEERAQNEHEVLEQAQQTFQAREAELTARLDEAARAAEAQSQDLRLAQGNLFAQEQELKRVQGELRDLRARLAQTVADLNAKLEASESTLGAAKQELEAAMAAAEERSRLESEIRSAQAQIAGLEQRRAQERAQSQAALDEERRKAEAARTAEREAGAQVLASTRSLYGRFAELAASQTDRGMLLKLAEADLRFPSGLAVLPRGDLPSLDRIASLLKDHPQLTALIEGHTDNAGPDDINLELSRARASAVEQALIERGVPAQRLTAEGAGETRPIADNATAAGRAQNRRVEVYVQEPAR